MPQVEIILVRRSEHGRYDVPVILHITGSLVIKMRFKCRKIVVWIHPAGNGRSEIILYVNSLPASPYIPSMISGADTLMFPDRYSMSSVAYPYRSSKLYPRRIILQFLVTHGYIVVEV